MNLQRRRIVQLACLSLTLPVLLNTRHAAAAQTLKVGDQTRTTQSLLEAAGLLEDVPYHLEFVQFPAAAPVMEALTAGAVDIGYGGDAATTYTLAAGNPSRIVAAYRSDPGCIALIVPKESSIESVKDLVGKKVAVTRGSVGHLLVASALKKANIPADQVQFRFLQPADAYPAFSAGGVDAWAIWTIYIARAVNDLGARVLIDGRGLVNNTAYQTARTDALEHKSDMMADYVSRVAKARRWAIEHLDEYAKVWAPMIGATPEIARSAYRMERMLPHIIDEGIVQDQQALVQYYASLGIIPKTFDIAPSFDRRFNSLVAKA